MSEKPSPLPTCIPGISPIVARKSPPFTPRIAVDATGRLGSFYDACCDRVLPESNLNFDLESVESLQSGNCFVKRDEIEEYSNLLKFCNIHNELRLSVALHMGQEMGVGALINYSRRTNRYTRLIFYTSYSRTDYMSDDQFKSLSSDKSSIPDTSATHVIVLVNWGIDAIAVVQLPPINRLIETFDHLLKKLCTSLSDNRTDDILLENNKTLLEQIVHTEVFSNIPDLASIKSIFDFYRQIPLVKNDTNFIRPCNYSLCPIEIFNIMKNSTQVIFKELETECSGGIEIYLRQLSHTFTKLGATMTENYKNLSQYLKEDFSNMQTRWLDLKNMYIDEVQRVKELVIRARRVEIKQIKVPETLNNDNKEELQRNIDDFGKELNAMRNKELLIGNLIKRHFEYRNVVDYEVTDHDDEETLVSKISVDGNYHRAICFNDSLRIKNKAQWDQLNVQSTNEKKQDPQLRFLYVDFSYSSYQLTNFIILPMIKNENNTSVPESILTSVPSEPPTNDDFINILLFGESGVGKSTFINAFVNYLLFDKLDQAKNKSVVLIPVSFLITTGEDFQEQTIRFDGVDTMNNEDHDSPGQSATQHCRSYVFTLKHGENKGKKLRIIDTPGIGDVRGLAQDDINMQHILTYINNLTYLNAVCILVKPNNTRLNILFRTCFMQLIDLLGENVSERMFFCFTNSRATFYTPGSTARLLKKLFESLPVKQVPFSKNNTFCFDSESFRYLLAIQNGVKFSESEETEYQDSWQKSSNESKRFLKYIETELTATFAPSENKSVKDAQLKIIMMVRPLLESMRNILRNIVFCKAGHSSISIELRPKSVRHATAICLTCPRSFAQVGDFWVNAETLHRFHNKCGTCSCSAQKHYSIDYELEYELCNHPASHHEAELKTMLDEICQMSAEFGHFLIETTDNTEKDLFLIDMERMIKEEEDICANKTPNKLNLNLRDYLIEIKKKYEETMVKLLAEKQEIPLLDVYDKIEEMSKYDIIKSQVAAAEEWHKFMIKYYEYEVSI